MALDPLQEALDPATDPTRLRQLADHEDEAVHRAARRNPSLPEEVWRTAFLEGKPEAWTNPMAPIYVLTWTPRQSDLRTTDYSIRQATYALWKEPERCSLEGKALLNAKVQEWWTTSESADDMVVFLGTWAKAKGKDSIEHREVTRILILCVRTVEISVRGLQDLARIEAWSKDNKVEIPEALAGSSHSSAVNSVIRFVLNPSYSPWDAMYETMLVIRDDEEDDVWEEAEYEHQRRLADLIRRERPLPPVAE
jgi:hypothetical protein